MGELWPANAAEVDGVAAEHDQVPLSPPEVLPALDSVGERSLTLGAQPSRVGQTTRGRRVSEAGPGSTTGARSRGYLASSADAWSWEPSWCAAVSTT